MENTLSDWQGFDCLNVLKVQTNWKSTYLEEIERQKIQFVEKFIKQKEKRCKNVCVSYEKNENYKPKSKKWKVKLPNGDIESFDNKRDAEVFASVMMCHLSLDSKL
jgi:hypothetical protein